MPSYPDCISEKRIPVPTPEAIVEGGKAHFGTFTEPFRKLNLLDCDKPCGRLMPDCMKKSRLTEWEAVELNLKEGILVSAIYNTGPIGFSIFVWYDKRKKKIFSWRNVVPVKKAKVASQLIDDDCYLKTDNSEYRITNDLLRGKAYAKGFTEGKNGRFALDVALTRISPPSVVSIPFGENKPLYSEKDFLKAEGYVEVNGEKFVTDEYSVGIIDDHKGYYPYRAHYDCNQSTDQDAYNENLIWKEGEAYPLPPVKFFREKRSSPVWEIRDDYGTVDLRFEIDATFLMPIKLLVASVYYALPFGRIYGFVVDAKGRKYVVDGMYGIGEDKTTRM